MIRSIVGDAAEVLADIEEGSVACAVTSPPYLEQRRYGPSAAELGHESTLDGYVTALLSVASGVRRTLTPDGVFWVNIGDKANYTGGAGGDWAGKPGGAAPFRDPTYPRGSWLDVPGAFAHAMIGDGWRLRSRIVWDKGRPKPESARHVRRPLCQHETIFLFAVGSSYRWYPSMLPTPADIWRIAPGGDGPAHLAPFPDELARRCIAATTLPGDLVLDPFGGSGTVGTVADRMGRDAIHIDLYHHHPHPEEGHDPA